MKARVSLRSLSGGVLATSLAVSALASAALAGDWTCPFGDRPCSYGYGGHGVGPGHMMDYNEMAPWMGGPGMMGPGMMGPRWGRGAMGYPPLGSLLRLDLSKEQRDQIDALARGLREKHAALRDQLWQQQRTLQELYSQNPPDLKAIEELNEAVASTRRQLVEESVEARNQGLKLLTESQRKQLEGLSYYRGG